MNQERYDAARSAQIALAFKGLSDLRSLGGMRDMPAIVQSLVRKYNEAWQAIAAEIQVAIDAPDQEVVL